MKSQKKLKTIVGVDGQNLSPTLPKEIKLKGQRTYRSITIETENDTSPISINHCYNSCSDSCYNY